MGFAYGGVFTYGGGSAYRGGFVFKGGLPIEGLPTPWHCGKADPPCRQTDIYENITFLQLCLQVVMTER